MPLREALPLCRKLKPSSSIIGNRPELACFVDALLSVNAILVGKIGTHSEPRLTDGRATTGTMARTLLGKNVVNRADRPLQGWRFSSVLAPECRAAIDMATS